MRLKSDFIISAALRKADRLAISVFIYKKGDPDAGAIFLELVSDRDSVQLLHRRFDFDENEIWECLNKGEPQPAYIISEQIERENTPDIVLLGVCIKYSGANFRPLFNKGYLKKQYACGISILGHITAVRR